MKIMTTAGALLAVFGAVLVLLNVNGALAPVSYGVLATMEPNLPDKVVLPAGSEGESEIDITNAFGMNRMFVLGWGTMLVGCLTCLFSIIGLDGDPPKRKRWMVGIAGGLWAVSGLVYSSAFWQCIQIFQFLVTGKGVDPSVLGGDFSVLLGIAKLGAFGGLAGAVLFALAALLPPKEPLPKRSELPHYLFWISVFPAALSLLLMAMNGIGSFETSVSGSGDPSLLATSIGAFLNRSVLGALFLSATGVGIIFVSRYRIPKLGT